MPIVLCRSISERSEQLSAAAMPPALLRRRNPSSDERSTPTREAIESVAWPSMS
ncbi:MAG: hypothetical protein GVY28_14410 [Alphaproteobacteria bacterium]|nr:hypothetical protein [Alphaproteobacteria bacterium]